MLNYSSLRNEVERSFRVLTKWRILLKMPKYLVTKQPNFIVARMAFDSFIEDNSINDADFQ
jgi:hypothetical protein